MAPLVIKYIVSHEEETVEHVILHYTATSKARSKGKLQELIGSHSRSHSHSHPTTPRGMLDANQPKVLLQYFKAGWSEVSRRKMNNTPQRGTSVQILPPPPELQSDTVCNSFYIS